MEMLVFVPAGLFPRAYVRKAMFRPHEIFTRMSDTMKYLFDGISVSTAVATVTGLLPHLAALVTIVWTGIRIYETRTVREWLGKKSYPSDEDWNERETRPMRVIPPGAPSNPAVAPDQEQK